MKKCDICGGGFKGNECPFENAKDLPWVEDYVQMRKGELEHEGHQRNVARWVLHGTDEHAESVVVWAKKTMLIEK